MIKKTEQEISKTWNKKYDNPVVTIQCMTYNQEDYIAMALDGFLMQETEFPFEILVHDDASTDKTADVIRKYELAYPNIIKPIYEKENQYSKRDGSLSRIVNSQIRGKYVLLCEGDDYWIDSSKVQMQIAYMLNHPECSLCFHAVNYLLEGIIIKNDRICNHECDISTDRIIMGGGSFCATASLCFKTKDYMNRPKFRQIASVGDYPLQIMLATIGTVHYFPNICGVYRVNAKGSWTNSINVSVDKKVNQWNNQIDWLNEYNNHFNKKHNDAVVTRIGFCYCALYRVTKQKTFLKKSISMFGETHSFIMKKKQIIIILKAILKVNLPFLVNITRKTRNN